MPELSLKHGHTYRNRLGEAVTVTQRTGDFNRKYPFIGAGDSFTVSGHVVGATCPEDQDLIDEVTVEPTAPQSSVSRHIALVQRKGRWKLRAFKTRELAQADSSYRTGVDVTLFA
jgi:hypothetical protein